MLYIGVKIIIGDWFMKTIKDIDLKNKKVVIRVDYNVPMEMVS